MSQARSPSLNARLAGRGRGALAGWVRLAWLWLWGLGFMVAAHAAHAAPLAVERSLLIDPEGRWTIDEVVTREFQPAPPILARGYSPSVVWLRVTVPPTELRSLVAMVRPVYLDDLQVYEALGQAAPGQAPIWKRQQAGDRIAFRDRPRQELAYTFDLQPTPGQVKVFYVRLQTTSTQALNVTVRSLEETLDQNSLQFMLAGFYASIVMVLVVLSLIRFAITSQRLWALNCVMQFVSLLLSFAFLGLWAKYVTPDNGPLTDLITCVLICLHFHVVNVYYGFFSRSFQGPRWVFWLRMVCVPVLGWQLWAVGHGQTLAAMQINTQLVLLTTLLGQVDVWFFKIEDRALRLMVRVMYTVQFLYLLYMMLPLMGVGQMSELHMMSALLVNLFGAIMQHLVLTMRDALVHRNQKQFEARMRETQQQLEWALKRRLETSGFLSMLLHELKNPLASIRLAALNLRQGRAGPGEPQLSRLERIQQAVEGMDAVLERCRQVDRLEQGGMRLQFEPTDVMALWTDCRAHAAPTERLRGEGPESWVLPVEPMLFKTMLCNLLDNALAYSAPDSEIHYRWRVDPDQPSRALFELRNQPGKPGFPDEARLFQKYYRAEAAHQRTGSGLGLYLVKHLAVLCGGDLRYHREGDWVVFELSWPLDHAAETLVPSPYAR
ncbi:7TM-DISM domain-containing protein [Curvibacter sp. HBC61]|uniref:histidine kinase n=1 Tax=Curvibacter cyanobacteriorum TaxID=3026422 RepID=A0ABT5MZW7_9BURK|nr:7TM-DISM domain-containing protein [Curvibacter sp. HBC61]MDD0839611.1 7TM-DISM domain-containing protein [Curvibacter sp. HBC61]